MDFDQGMIVEGFGNGGGKSVAVDGQCAAGGNLIGVGGTHDQRSQPAHFRVQQPNRIVGGIVRAKRIGTHEFGEAVGAMGFGHPVGPHLVQNHWNSRFGNLPGCLRAGEAGADNMHGPRGRFDACHGETGSAFSGAVECARRLCAADLAPANSSAGYDNARSEAGVIRLNSRLKSDQPL